MKHAKLSRPDIRFLCLQNFIKKYVQCYNCGNPETVVKIKKESIYLNARPAALCPMWTCATA